MLFAVHLPQTMSKFGKPTSAIDKRKPKNIPKYVYPFRNLHGEYHGTFYMQNNI
jgi:hypothetical protein